MQEKKELDLDELENVTGGKQYNENLPTCGPEIEMANSPSYIGQNVYAVNRHNTSQWALCLLMNAVYDDDEIEAEYTIQTVTINNYTHRVMFGRNILAPGEQATLKSRDLVLYANN